MLQAALLLTLVVGLQGIYLPVKKDNIWYKSFWEGKPNIFFLITDMSWEHTPFAVQISSEDISQSMQHGESMLAEKDQITRNIKSKNMSLPRDSPAYMHQILFKRSSPRSIELSKKGYMMDQATSFLKDKLKLSKMNVTFDLFWSETCNETSPTPVCGSTPYRSANGTCNNINNPNWGATFSPFRRLAPTSYGDGVSSLRLAQDGFALPSARRVSSTVRHPRQIEGHPVSVLFMTYGQFLDHDLTFAPVAGENGEAIPCCPEALGDTPPHPECAPISIPADDPFYAQFNQTCMEFIRSASAPRCHFGPREQMNERTAYIDGSQIYGTSDEMMKSLRTMEDGLLVTQITKEGTELLPPIKDLSNACNREEKADADQFCFQAGDMRVNEQILLTLFHTVWARHHNNIAAKLKSSNPAWNDEKLFQEARRIVGAQLQVVTYNEYLPRIIGSKPYLSPFDYTNYDSSISAGISAEFATAAFRFGHSQIASTVETLNSRFGKTSTELSSLFMNPFDLYIKGEIPKLMRGEVNQHAPRVDTVFTEEVSGKLFRGGLPFGLDLVSLNLQRGRDHGVASYTTVRSICDNFAISSFHDLQGIMDAEAIESLKSVYNNVHDIDLFIGGLAEKPLLGARVGPTFDCILSDQFIRLKYGDRFWYKSATSNFTPKQMQALSYTTLASILCETIPELVFIQLWPLLVPTGFYGANRVQPCSEYYKLNMTVFKES
ncbi:salivary peroxidase/catechol oxidase-like [Penaeus vannamei]